jgi:hypothetical protein
MAAPANRRWVCVVGGWSKVILTREAAPGPGRILSARSDDPRDCDVSRFSDRVDTIETREAQSAGGAFVAVRGGPFAGACLTVTTNAAGGAPCDVEIFTPAETTDASGLCRQAFGRPVSATP